MLGAIWVGGKICDLFQEEPKVRMINLEEIEFDRDQVTAACLISEAKLFNPNWNVR
jgi:hypothetical protein